ncbi:MAG: DNA cytosine methyltransferase [Eubacterium sp.]|nr:DNA cytosine methyltransferase [Eubacterium sp.]
MEIRKKIKNSKRGLTFSLSENSIKIGTHYRYVVDKVRHQILIIPDENGQLIVSRKKTKYSEKPLFDIRSKDVREMVATADYLEVVAEESQIVVFALKKANTAKSKICSIEEIFGTAIGKIVIPYAKASGSESEFYQYSLDDWLSTMSVSDDDRPSIIRDVKKIYDVVSLFSGAGLFDKAWLDTGRFRFVYANDFNEEVKDTYTYNIGDHMVCKDIRKVKGNELPFADVFLASPCCQAFSNANRRNLNTIESEEKRLLVEEIVRLTNEVRDKPKVVVVENVPRMLTKENGLYISKLLEGLPEYEAEVKIICDYKVGGYTMRERCIVILSRIGKITLPDIEVLPAKTVKDALKQVDSTWYNYNDYTIPKQETVKKMKYVPQGGNWKDIPKDIFSYGPHTHSDIMRRLSYDEIAPTITNVRKNNIMPPEGDRCLSVAESTALMGLKKDFRLIGRLGAKQQMIANGVTQAIGKFVANTVLKQLDRMLIPAT